VTRFCQYLTHFQPAAANISFNSGGNGKTGGMVGMQAMPARFLVLGFRFLQRPKT
jgi:hypothetical protein